MNPSLEAKEKMLILRRLESARNDIQRLERNVREYTQQIDKANATQTECLEQLGVISVDLMTLIVSEAYRDGQQNPPHRESVPG